MTPVAQSKNLVVNADDFGLSTGVNRAIVDCHARGIVTSTSLMVRRPQAIEAVALAHGHPRLSLGLHWDFCADGAGMDPTDHAQIREEFARQLDLFVSLTGRLPTHVDSEQHFHREHGLLPLFEELVAPLKVPLRHTGQVRYVSGFYAQWEYKVTRLEYVELPALERLLREGVGEGWTELSCHPGYVTADYRSDYYAEREVEVRTLTAPSLRTTLAELGIRLASYADYAASQRDKSGRDPLAV